MSPECQNSVSRAANFVLNPRQLRETGGALRGYWVPPQKHVGGEFLIIEFDEAVRGALINKIVEPVAVKQVGVGFPAE